MPTKLQNIKGKEVSLVDRPANKRKFLLIKNKEGAMTTKVQFLGLESLCDQAIPAEVLSEVIKSTKLVIDRSVSLTETLERFQKDEGDGQGEVSAKEVVEEFQTINGLLNSILQKSDPAERESDQDESIGDNALTLEEIAKALAELTKKVEEGNTTQTALQGKFEELEKKMAETPPPADQGTKETPPAKEEPTVDVAKALTDHEAKIVESVKKASDERAVELTKMFQEAAKEEFGGLAERVGKIEKALTGGETSPASDEGSQDYKRHYGHEEKETQVTEADNPFTSMFNAVKDF